MLFVHNGCGQPKNATMGHGYRPKRPRRNVVFDAFPYREAGTDQKYLGEMWSAMRFHIGIQAQTKRSSDDLGGTW
jgi:hypothetical protein